VSATLGEITTTLFGDSGVVCESLSESFARELGVERCMNLPAKKVHIVRDRMWLDIQAPQNVATAFEDDGFMHTVLYATQ